MSDLENAGRERTLTEDCPVCGTLLVSFTEDEFWSHLRNCWNEDIVDAAKNLVESQCEPHTGDDLEVRADGGVDDREREYDGRGYEHDYEPGEDEVSSFTWAKLNLLYEADYVAFGTHDNPPHYKSDQALFIFDHPDYEGGLCVPIRLGELGVYRAVRRTRPERQGRGYWTMEEDVGIFEDLPDWVNHTPLERDGNENTGSQQENDDG